MKCKQTKKKGKHGKFLIAALGHHRWYVSWYVCDNPIWLSIFLYGIPGVTFDLSLTPILYDETCTGVSIIQPQPSPHTLLCSCRQIGWEDLTLFKFAAIYSYHFDGHCGAFCGLKKKIWRAKSILFFWSKQMKRENQTLILCKQPTKIFCVIERNILQIVLSFFLLFIFSVPSKVIIMVI